MKKVCVVTATRAEYGLLRNVMRLIQNDNELELILFVTGMHLSSEYGMTVQEIEKDGFLINEKMDILMSSNSANGVSKSMGMASILFADAFEKYRPDMLVVLGDRYELIPICSAALNYNIPITHISGGETTEGAIDECVRHCITKMSYLHFPGCETYRKRIIQLGEEPSRVYNFGDVGIELTKSISLLDKEQISTMLDVKLKEQMALVIFHPTTFEVESVEEQADNLLKAIDYFNDIQFIIIKGNTDAGGKKIYDKMANFVNSHDNCIMFDSLNVQIYISLLSICKFLLGNSSSGIVEAPSCGVPTINIGNRQKGRLQAESIINCGANEGEIVEAIKRALDVEFQQLCKNVDSPYGKGDTSRKVVDVIKEYLIEEKIDLKKKFYDVEF